MSQRNRPESGQALVELLKAKSRSRRANLRANSSPETVSFSKRNDLTPILEMVQRSPSDLMMPARNVRSFDIAHIREIARSIAELGFTDPVLIDESSEVLDGVVRVEAAKLLGMPHIPCLLARHLSSAQRRQLRLAVNRLQEKGSWDLGELRVVMQELIVENVSLEVAGFTLSEVDQIVLDDDPPLAEVGELEPAPDAKPVARLGDVFALGTHRLVCGDCRDLSVLRSAMQNDCARLILTDQPYNVPISGNVTMGNHREFAMASGEMSERDFSAFNSSWMAAALAHLADGGLFATFIDWRGYANVHAAAIRCGLSPLNLIVWGKNNAGMGSLYRSRHELLPLYKKGNAPHVNNVKLGKDGRWRSNLWEYHGASSAGSEARAGARSHPTVKPSNMLEDALLDLTNRGDVVLDPFLGSGSMLIAAERAGRVCRAVEIDPQYVDVAIRRWQTLTGRHAVLESTGQRLEELTADRSSIESSPHIGPSMKERHHD